MIVRRQSIRRFSVALRRDQAYVNGKWITGLSTFDVLDPGTEDLLGKVPEMSAEDCKEAVTAAQNALPAWKALTGKERGNYLRGIYNLHMENIDELAELLSYESGKPMAESKGEILYGASYFEWFAEESKRIYGDTIPEPIPNRKILTWREPVGVCGLITPWNFPNAMIARKIAPALAAGCTTVVKPAADTPLSTLAIAAMAEKVGLPSGVLNVVTCSNAKAKDIGEALTSDSRVRKISFTGSTRVGQILLRDSAMTVKRTSMELGGNAPFIVFGNADIEKAADGLMLSKFRNAGQTCVCANRIYVHRSIYDTFSQAVLKRVNALNVGWFKSNSDITMGPLINKMAVEKVDGMVKDAINDGAQVLTGGKPLPEVGANFYAPTILGNCNKNMRVIKEEIFGPVVPFVCFDTEDEVIEQANSSEAGLASYFFNSNVGDCLRIAGKIESGIVGVNTGVISTEVAPFGGIKHSGMGREGSKYGCEDYTELKSVTIQL